MSQSDQCVTCAHKWHGALMCDAFEEIPYEIVSGQHDHTKPFEGDHGIRWAPKKDRTPAGGS